MVLLVKQTFNLDLFNVKKLSKLNKSEAKCSPSESIRSKYVKLFLIKIRIANVKLVPSPVLKGRLITITFCLYVKSGNETVDPSLMIRKVVSNDLFNLENSSIIVER
jgi:hypothetical protein